MQGCFLIGFLNFDAYTVYVDHVIIREKKRAGKWKTWIGPFMKFMYIICNVA